VKTLSFQEIINYLNQYWADYGCLIRQPYDLEKGAATMSPATFFGALGPKPLKVAYVDPVRRPADGRYGENPNRLYKHYQYQVILKPAPADCQKLYLKSLEALGIKLKDHDVKFLEDDWESPTLGAWGLGWEVRVDGLEITQFTYFQQVGGIDLKMIPVELTYGLERIAMFLQGKDNVYDLDWNGSVTYGDVHHRDEYEFSKFHFELADPEAEKKNFQFFESEAGRILKEKLVMPAYDYLLKCSHTFNLLDARGALSVTERADYVRRVRSMARRIAVLYLELNEKE